MRHCPRCNNADLVSDKGRTPADADGVEVTSFNFYCPRCDLYESMREDDPGFDGFLRRWTRGPEGDGGGAPGRG